MSGVGGQPWQAPRPRLTMAPQLLLLLLALSGPLGASARWPLRADGPVTLGGRAAALPVVSVANYGAVADGVADSTHAFELALAALAKAGGGVLHVPEAAAQKGNESVYTTLPLQITTSHVTLRLDANTRLLARCDIPRWPLGDPWSNFGEAPQYVPYLWVVNATDFALEGSGAVDGNGTCFWPTAQGHNITLKHTRPRLIVIQGVARVSVTGITVTNSPYWTLVFYESTDIHVSGLVVHNPSGGKGRCTTTTEGCFGPNADGMRTAI